MYEIEEKAVKKNAKHQSTLSCLMAGMEPQVAEDLQGQIQLYRQRILKQFKWRLSMPLVGEGPRSLEMSQNSCLVQTLFVRLFQPEILRERGSFCL